MDLAKQAQIIDNIHDTLVDFVGQKLRVRANMGRSKIIESEGVLMQVHPKLFIMEVQRKRGTIARQSYQYVDILTGMVELSQNGEKIFGPFIEEDPEELDGPESYADNNTAVSSEEQEVLEVDVSSEEGTLQEGASEHADEEVEETSEEQTEEQASV